MTPAKLFPCELIEILQNTSGWKTFQGKHLHQSSVPVTLKGMPCDFLEVGLCQEHFQMNIGIWLFRDRYSTKHQRLFIFKINALSALFIYFIIIIIIIIYIYIYIYIYIFFALLCSTVFEHDKHVMINMLNNLIEDNCFESIHDDIIKRKRKFSKEIDEIFSGFQ